MKQFILLFCLVIPSVALTQNRVAEFFTVIDSVFNSWDKNKDGILTREEVDDLVANPKVKGKSAAALSAIQQMLINKKIELPPLTKAYFVEQISRDGKPGQPDFQRRYVNALNKIQGSSRAMLSGNITLESMHQGRMGDCYLIAPLGAMVSRDQSDIRKMFKEKTADGQLIQFADGHSVTVPMLTDTEISLTGTTEGHGLWLAMLEKATALVKQGENESLKDVDSVAGAVGSGGSTVRFMTLLTGHKCTPMVFHEKDSSPKAVEAKVKVKLADVKAKLKETLDAKRIVCCSSTKESGIPGLASRHAYAVIGFDSTKDMVRVWNPHGNKFEPKGPPGLVNGYANVDGKFTVPLKEFVRAFHSMSCEGIEEAKYSGQKKK